MQISAANKGMLKTPDKIPTMTVRMANTTAATVTPRPSPTVPIMGRVPMSAVRIGVRSPMRPGTRPRMITVGRSSPTTLVHTVKSRMSPTTSWGAAVEMVKYAKRARAMAAMVMAFIVDVGCWLL